MATLIGKALFRVARAFRLTSYLVGGLTAVALIASPFIASSIANWLALVTVTLGIAVVVYLTLYRGIPTLLSRCAMALLPADQMGYARAELAIWDYESRHGSAGAAIRRELHTTLDDHQNGL